MGRNFFRSAGFAIALSTPGVIAIAALVVFGLLDRTAAIVAVTAMLALSALMAIGLVVALIGVRAAIDRLGPEAPPGAEIAPGDLRH
ncbi:MAG: hypothetical protein WA459_22505, partial [Stellaceae bacterium]